MGRHLFRRKALILPFLLFLLGLSAAFPCAGQALPDSRRLHAAGPAPASLALPPAQGHRGPEVYALNVPDDPRVRAWLERYRRNGGAAKALARARFYRTHIAARLAERGLPGELLFLPVLESDYRAEAVSTSGAVGLWQFMANTARPLGLSMDAFLDERRDFFKATDAALAKLEENYRYFSDWPLALAAYNCGLGRLARIVRSQGGDFASLAERGLLPRETADYLPRFYALVRLLSYPGRHGLETSWEDSPRWRALVLRDSVSLLLLAEETGLDEGILRRANAELEYPITPLLPEGYLLKVPAGWAARVEEALGNPELRLLDFRTHRIASGDTFFGIAESYDVPLPLLLRHNPNLDPRRLPLGGVVAVPLVRAGAGPPPRRPAPAPAWPASGLYTVQPGDTLWALSRRYGVSSEELAAANKLELDDILKEGMMLTVPVIAH